MNRSNSEVKLLRVSTAYAKLFKTVYAFIIWPGVRLFYNQHLDVEKQAPFPLLRFNALFFWPIRRIKNFPELNLCRG